MNVLKSLVVPCGLLQDAIAEEYRNRDGPVRKPPVFS